jgi:small subunit ribosomal protein S2
MEQNTSLQQQLLEAGVHFGHLKKKWNPKMLPYIFAEKKGIHIIDLNKTVDCLQETAGVLKQIARSGKKILFVGTKKQAQDIVEEEAKRCGMYYVSQRWLGGMLTNFNTIQGRIDYLVRLEDKKSRGELDYMSKKDKLKLEKEMAKLNKLMGGFKEMTTLPGAIFIVDPTKEKIALSEAKKVGVKLVATVDTNCDPDGIDYIIPANDDAIKAIKVICSRIADAVLEGKMLAEAGETKEAAEPGETVPAEAAAA